MPDIDIKKFLNEFFSILGFNSEQSEQSMKDINGLISVYFMNALISKLTPEESVDVKNKLAGKSSTEQQVVLIEVIKSRNSAEEVRKIFLESANKAITDYMEGMSHKVSPEQKQQVFRLIEESELN